MKDGRHLLILLLCGLGLYFLTGMINNHLATHAVFLHVDALLVVFPGLFLRRLSGLLVVLPLAFLQETATPAAQGTYLFGYLGMWLFFIWAQPRIRRQNTFHLRWVALVAQVLLTLYLLAVVGHTQWQHLAFWQRVLSDTVISCVVIVITVGAWCRFQQRLLQSRGWDLEAEFSEA
jgi:hypothetical protein